MAWQTTSERLAEAMEKARRHWRRGARPAAEAAAPVPPARAPGFTVSLSREAGAEGSEIARTVGARLGWPVYDRELVQRIAEEMGLRAELLESVDERRQGWLRECVESFRSGPVFGEAAYTHRLADVLAALAAHGECVIVGRGAAQVLPPATTLRVRVVAPLAHRVAVVARRQALTEQEARCWVELTDRERDRFVKDHFRKDPGDPRLYDLVLNSGRFGPEDCADLIVDGLRRLQARVPAAAPV
jgi:cytidylate kinase